MRRMLLFLLMCALLAPAAGVAEIWTFGDAAPAPTQTPQAAAQAPADTVRPSTVLYIVNCMEYVTLRAQPDTGAEALAHIPLGARVQCYGDVENGFSEVEYEGAHGYVLTEYLGWVEPAPEQEGEIKYVVNCKEYVTLRTRPDTSADAAARIPLGEQVTSYGAEGGFDRVSYAGMAGYVLSKYLSSSPDTFGARLVEQSELARLESARVEAYASSEQIDQYGYYSAANASDGDPTTTWAEGVNGIGEGEWISFFFDEQLVAGFAIRAGYQRSRDAYIENARPAQILISVAEAEEFSIALDDVRGEQIVLFNRPALTDYLSIEILSAYSGTAYADTCISEVRILLAE